MSAPPGISVVVCSFNGAETLGACLEALEHQTIRDQIEIIVVDDGSTDATAEVARRFDVDLIVHPANRGLAIARNTGVERAVAPIVAFTDDDCIPEPTWLERLRGVYDRPTVAAAGGLVVPARSERWLHRYLCANNPLQPLELDLAASSSWAYRGALYARRNAGLGRRSGERAVYSLVGANLSARREDLVEVGLFSTQFTFGGEDEDMCRRLQSRRPDHSLVFLPDAIVRHDFDPRLRDTLRRSRGYGRGNGRSFAGDPLRSPTVYPVPVLIVGLTMAGLRRPRWIVAAAAVPLLLFPRWIVQAFRRRHLSDLTFAYVQVLQEAASNVGFLDGWWAATRRARQAAGAEGVAA